MKTSKILSAVTQALAAETGDTAVADDVLACGLPQIVLG
jgi:hypothetical protein